MDVFQILIGIAIGSILTWIVLFVIHGKRNLYTQQQKVQLETNVKQVNKQVVEYKEESEKLRNELVQSKMHIAAVDTENTHLIKINEEKINEVEQLQKKLTVEFENIANRVLSHRSKEINEQNQQKINDLLSPLKEKISSFEKKVEETYDKEVRDNLSLKAEVKRLFELNNKISEEAGSLTRALKGDVKKIGNWGEMILERVLEESGLTKGREYRREVSDKNSEGQLIRPDVIIDLPESKHLIVDSKFSLRAYDEYINAQEKDEKENALKRHKSNLREHVKGLFEKNYSSATAVNSPDFVLMFIPVEASFAIAVESDSELFAYAWERKIVPVSPSTLLATLKTISFIWRQENQSKNAQEIAKQSGALYDKLVNFLLDLEKVGQNIDQLQNNYSNAMQKLQTGRGNLISKAEKIKVLGAKANKSIPNSYKKE